MHRFSAVMALMVMAAVSVAPGVQVGDTPAPRPIRAAVYRDTGVSRSIGAVVAQLSSRDGLQVAEVKAADIWEGKLSGFDVLIQPGGIGGGQGSR